jgi:hypothetical protein
VVVQYSVVLTIFLVKSDREYTTVLGQTVLVHVPPMSRAARRTSIDTTYTTTSTRDSSINMNPIHEATAAIESRDPGDKLVYQEYARYFDVDRSTLSRRHKGCQGTQEAKNLNQSKLTPQQEEELVLYIGDLTGRGLPPTNTMIQNFASTIAHERVSLSWVTRFKHRHEDALISKWGRAMDATRHKADSYYKYKLYFELLHGKMEEHKILPHNSYNMDEKGFIIGVIGNSKRVFTRAQWELKQVTAALQDGSRKWITTIAAICADGTALPPGLIYESANCTLQST